MGNIGAWELAHGKCTYTDKLQDPHLQMMKLAVGNWRSFFFDRDPVRQTVKWLIIKNLKIETGWWKQQLIFLIYEIALVNNKCLQASTSQVFKNWETRILRFTHTAVMLFFSHICVSCSLPTSLPCLKIRFDLWPVWTTLRALSMILKEEPSVLWPRS